MKILLGMSGGLDSAYSAELLKEKGHTVEGAELKMHGYTDLEGAEKAAVKAGIKLHIIDCSEAFEKNVAAYFAKEYMSGRTPNPCVVCNKTVKIKYLVDYALENGFERAATGHYARIGEENGRYFIMDGADERKNQSYMLWGLSQEQIKHLLFPLGGLIKEEIRKEADALGLESAKSKESQDICFLPSGSYAEFVKSRCGEAPKGDFIDENGRVLGRHKGIINYTVGQRKGLGIALGERMFVSAIDPIKNTVMLKKSGEDLYKTADLIGMNYQLMSEESGQKNVLVKIRYASRPVPARLIANGDKGTLVFETPIKAVTPGQSAVMYEDGKILCGGVIDKAESGRGRPAPAGDGLQRSRTLDTV